MAIHKKCTIRVYSQKESSTSTESAIEVKKQAGYAFKVIKLAKPENKSCHGCGLEAIDDCIASKGKKHIPALDSLFPCSQCVRNPTIKDRWDERWIYDAVSGEAIIEE